MENSVLHEMKILNSLIVRKVIKDFKKDNSPAFSHTQAEIIKYLLCHHNEMIYQKDIEKALNLRRSTISDILKTMQKNNIIKKCEDEQDARLKQIILTKEALSKAKYFHTKMENFEKLLFKNISKSEKQSFLETLKKMKNNISEEDNNDKIV